MPYTEATLWEILRISSIAPGSLFHAATANTQFDKYMIPKDPIIMTNLYKVHHDKEYWSDPEEFRPERFLSADGKSFVRGERVIPFGIGKRMCLGEKLAMIELFLFLTALVQAFNFKLDTTHGKPTLDPKVGLTFTPHPYKLIVSER